MHKLAVVLALVVGCNSAERTPPPLAACDLENPCAAGLVCVAGTCVARPETTLVATPPELSNTPTPTFMFEALGEATSFLCALDGATPVACQPPFEVTVSEGEHTFVVLALGPGGEDQTPATFHWTVDLTPPETSIAAGPLGMVNLDEATFGLEASEAADFLCGLDGAELAACPPSFTGLAEGEHILLAAARDRAGNLDASPAERRWTVDRTPPVAAIAEAPTSPTNAVWATFRFEATEEDLRWVYQLDDGAEQPSADPTVELEVGAGERQLAVWAVDRAGNRSAQPARHRWTVDTARPDTRIDRGPTARTRETSASFAFASSKPEGATFRCRLDGGGWTSCDAGTASYPGPLAEREHTFEVAASDPSGNSDPEPALWRWVVDVTPPAVAITSPAEGATTGPTVTVGITVTGARDCVIDGGAPAACPTSLTRSYANGAASITVTASDDVGNSRTLIRRWTVDADPPVVSISAPASGATTGPEVDLIFSVGDATTCSVDGAAYGTCPASPLHRTYLGGTRGFSIRGKDALGNESPPATVAFTVDADPPVVSISAPANGATTGPEVDLVFSVGDATTCSVDGAAYGPCPASPLHRTFAGGSRGFSIRGRDAVGNESTTASVSFTVDATPPIVSISAPVNGATTGPEVDLVFSVGDATACSVDGAAYGTCPASPLHRTLGAGPQGFSIRGRDAYGNQSPTISVSFTVDAAPPTVSISSPAQGSTTGKNVDVVFSVGDSAQCSVNGGGFGACPSSPLPRSYSTSGTATFSLQGRDAVGNLSAVVTRTWTVDADAPALQVTYPAENQLVRGPVVTVQLNPGDATRCTVAGTPYQPCPAQVTVSGLADGPRSVVVTAEDGFGNSAQVTRSFRVDGTRPALALACPSAPLGMSGSIGFTASDANFDRVSCALDGRPIACGPTSYSYSDAFPGEPTLDVAAWDLAGNVTEASCTFDVVTGRGHVVLFGHDFDNSESSPLERIVRNAVSLSNRSPAASQNEILLYLETTRARERDHVRALLETASPAPALRFAGNGGELLSELRRTRALIILDQNGTAAFDALSRDPEILDALDTFFAHGGVIVVLDGAVSVGQPSNTYVILERAGLFTPAAPAAILNPSRPPAITLLRPNDPLAAGWSSGLALPFSVGYGLFSARREHTVFWSAEQTYVAHVCTNEIREPAPCGY